MAKFKDVMRHDEELMRDEAKSEVKNVAASELFGSDLKDMRISVRMNSGKYNQFSKINKKMGASNSSVINMLVSEYIAKNKDMIGL